MVGEVSEGGGNVRGLGGCQRVGRRDEEDLLLRCCFDPFTPLPPLSSFSASRSPSLSRLLYSTSLSYVHPYKNSVFFTESLSDL